VLAVFTSAYQAWLKRWRRLIGHETRNWASGSANFTTRRKTPCRVCTA